MSKSILTGLVLFLAVAPAASADKWLEARSPNFTLITDLGKGRAEDVLEDLEKLRRLVTELFPAQPVDSPVPVGIYLFRNEKSLRPYQPLRDGKPEDWAAYFRSLPFKSFVAIDGSGQSEFVRELAFRQYLHLILSYGRVRYPLWLSNGFALFYGNAHFTKDHAEVGKMHDRHRRELGEHRSMPLQEVFAVTYQSPHYREDTRRALFDAQSWALMHYVLIGRNPEGGKILGRFLDLLAEDRDPLMAFQEAMGMPLRQIDAEVGTYIRKAVYQYWRVDLEPLDSARDFQFAELPPGASDGRLGQLLIAVGRSEEARAKLEAAIEAAPDLPDGYEGLGLLHEAEGRRVEALPFLERAAEKGSTNPMVHFGYAAALLDGYSGTVEGIEEPVRTKARSALERALVLDPFHPDAARLFGFVSLFDGNTEDGVSAVKKALEAHPQDPGLQFVLGQLYARQEHYSAARAIYERLLSRKLDPNLVAGVRQQLDWVIAKMGETP